MSNIACLLLVVGALFVPSIHCGQFTQTPEWANIKLRHVERGTVAPQIGKGASVSDYAAGAILMHEERFAADLQVRCSAYGHLFKLIDMYRENKNKPGALQVTPDTVVALNMVAHANPVEYNQLLTKYRALSLKRVFTAAIEGLELLPEQTEASNATWLELIDCASSIGLDAFLNVPMRAKRIEETKASVEGGADGSNKPSADGRKVVSLIDHGGEFLYSDLEEARAKVEKFDDDVLQTLRLRLLRERLNDQEIEKIITIMNARKDWVNKITAAPRNDRNKLQIGVVSTWMQYWVDLVKVTRYLDSIGAKSNESVKEFLSDAENQQLAEKMKETLDNYGKVKNIIAGLKLSKTYDSFEHLEKVYGPLEQMAKQIGQIVYDKKIVQEVENYKKHKAVNDFTTKHLSIL